MVELLQRNHRFAHGELAALRTALASGQRPFAAVVCCADSRVSPELIFESVLGELFVVRYSTRLVPSLYTPLSSDLVWWCHQDGRQPGG
jgi:carbonic anhydrase